MVTFSPLSRQGKWSNFDQFSLFESKIDHLIPYVIESKSLRRVSGQDPLICHRFWSSHRWWHYSPLSRLGIMEQFCSIFAVWVQIWPPYTLCKWKQIIEKSFWTGPLICHRFRSSQRWWHFSPLSRLGKIEQFCSIFAVWVQIWPPYTLCKWKQIIEKSI